MLFTLCASLALYAGALDFESFSFNDHLLALKGPGAPELFEDAVIFTAPSSSRRVGIAFSHEGFARVHWFKKLMKTTDLEIGTENSAKPKKNTSPFVDSGIMFLAYEYPRGLKTLEYRLIVDGLWTADPRNRAKKVDPASGVVLSLVFLPPPSERRATDDAAPGTLRFSYESAPGETITVAGTFNNWDPFMYELVEESPGRYHLTLPLPSGTYRYAFIHRGERVLDPNNPHKVYGRDGKTASEIRVN